MRFLGITSNGLGVMSGTATIGFAVTGSMSRLGEIGTNIPAVCPASMLQASNGTLLVATGLGPMYRMRYNEVDLSPAGVPAPKTACTILSSVDYANEISQTTDPLTARSTRLITVNFSQYGKVAGAYTGGGNNGTLVYSSEGQQSQYARLAMFQQYASVAAAQSASELTGGVPNSTLVIRLKNYLLGMQAVNTGNNKYSSIWDTMIGSFYIYDDAGTSGAANSNTGRYQCFQRWVDKDSYVSDPGPLSDVVQITARNVIKYQEVEAPTDSRIVKRQIWRNTSGQLQNFYLDIETTDLSSTSFTSSNTDEQLALADVITFTDVDGYTIPYLYAQPPNDKPFIAELRGRIFAVGSRRYTKGSSQVTNGSTTVTGVGTDWTNEFAGRRFIAGNKEYLIKTVDDTDQTMELATSYAGVTDNFALYTIAPYSAEENVIRWSDPTAGPEAWPLTAQLLMPQDGDQITGLVNYGDALYITKTRNIYRFNFSEDPGVDGQISPAAKRGCVNFRCAVSVEGACFMLDREGIHAFSGGPDPTHISLPVGDLFREGTNGYRINWNADLCFWHAILHQEISTIKWYVTLAGDTFPQHAICYDYRRNRFWLEEYPRPISSSCYSLAITGRPLLGTSEGKILAADTGSLDLMEPGSTLLTIASVNSVYSITLSESPKTCEGVPMVIVTGSAAGTDRIITFQDGAEIQFGTPMDIMPAKGDKIQLGGIKYHLKTASFNAQRMDGSQPIGFAMKVAPNEESELYGQLTIFRDGDSKKAVRNVQARSTWGATAMNPKRSFTQTELKMGTPLAIIKKTLDVPGESDQPINFEWQFGIDGSSGEVKPKIIEMRIDGAGN